MLYPLENQGTEPVGCITDDEGKAWLVLPEGGKYRAVISLPGGSKKCTVQPEPVREFSTVKTVVVNVP